MRLPSLISFIGFVVLITATWCPMLRPFHLFNWNVYQLNQPYGMVIMLTGVIGILGTVLNQPKITRLAAWIGLALAVLLLIAAVLKVKTTFSFIPFKGITDFLARQIKFKWGWFVLFAGPLIAITGSLFTRKPITVTDNTTVK